MNDKGFPPRGVVNLCDEVISEEHGQVVHDKARETLQEMNSYGIHRWHRDGETKIKYAMIPVDEYKKSVDDQRKVIEALYLMLSSADVWGECEDCSESWEKCNIHPLCKVFFNSDNIEQFTEKILEGKE